MGILIFILFMMVGILGFAVLLLFMRQNRMIEMEKKQQKQMQESEEIMSTFLMELKADNEAFLVELEARFPSQMKTEKLDRSIQNAVPEDETNDIPPPSVNRAHSLRLAQNAYQKNTEKKSGQPQENLTLNDRVLHMARQGFSVDEIAEKLHKGKTEIDLILKFNEK